MKTWVLAGGLEGKRPLLEDPREFAWLRAFIGRHRPPLIDENRPNDAAQEVADQGGLPMEITGFHSALDGPGSETGAGIRGRWGQRRFTGKAQLDCVEGDATVLTISVRKNRAR